MDKIKEPVGLAIKVIKRATVAVKNGLSCTNTNFENDPTFVAPWNYMFLFMVWSFKSVMASWSCIGDNHDGLSSPPSSEFRIVNSFSFKNSVIIRTSVYLAHIAKSKPLVDDLVVF